MWRKHNRDIQNSSTDSYLYDELMLDIVNNNDSSATISYY